MLKGVGRGALSLAALLWSVNASCVNFHPGPLALPPERVSRYRAFAGRSGLVCGLRPEHVFEERRHLEPGQAPC